MREGWGGGGGGAEREGKTLREENKMPKVVKPGKMANNLSES